MRDSLLKKISDYRKSGNYEDGIHFAKQQIENLEDKEVISKANLMLGNLYDQYALQKTGAKKKELQNKALKHLKKALDFNKFEALRGMANVYHHQNKPKRAIHYYKKAHKADPTKAGSFHNSLGNVYQRMGLNNNDKNKLIKATKHYDKSLSLADSKENRLIPLTNLAILSKNLKNHKKAEKYAKEALEIIEKTESNYVKENMKNTLADILEKR